MILKNFDIRGIYKGFNFDDGIGIQGHADLTGWWIPDTDTMTFIGNKVSVWNDNSYNGYEVLMAIDANRPTFSSNIVNGIGAMDFSAAGQQLLFSSGAFFSQFVEQQGYHLFVVFKPSGTTTNSATITSNHRIVHHALNKWGVYSRNDSGQVKIYAYHNDGADNYFAFNATDNTPYLMEFRCDGATMRARLNDGTIQSGACGPITQWEQSNLQFSSTGATTTYDGYISEVIIFRHDVGDFQSRLIRDYLNAKYSLY